MHMTCTGGRFFLSWVDSQNSFGTTVSDIAGWLESAYSLNWGAREIWGQDLGTFMISRPI